MRKAGTSVLRGNKVGSDLYSGVTLSLLPSIYLISVFGGDRNYFWAQLTFRSFHVPGVVPEIPKMDVLQNIIYSGPGVDLHCYYGFGVQILGVRLRVLAPAAGVMHAKWVRH